jgi:hypothetical protein
MVMKLVFNSLNWFCICGLVEWFSLLADLINQMHRRLNELPALKDIIG